MLKTLCGLALLVVSAHAFSKEYSFEDVQKLRNDKEAMISSFKKRDIDKILGKFQEPTINKRVLQVFYQSMYEFLNNNQNVCELNLIEVLIKNFKAEKLPVDKESLDDLFKLIRIQNGIDDILYEILSSDSKDYFALKALGPNRPSALAGFSSRSELLEQNDLAELYSNFKEFPDEIDTCAYQEFVFLKNSIKAKSGKKSDRPLKDMKVLNQKALEEKLISGETYSKLEYLRDKSDLPKRIVLLKDYLKIIFNAKNKLSPLSKSYQPVKLEDEDKYSSERIKRFSDLTRRKVLYKKYDETQIILLAQVLQKASRRMGVDADTKTGVPYISQEFSVLQPNGERETYVERFDLDPQSQFNLARRLMRKDIVDLQMMDLFVGLKITYQDVVLAAFETGHISIEDIAYVVRYDDLWNPETSKFERVSGFVFKVAGYSTFFLPTPWNVIGTIALGVVEGIVDQKTSTGAQNDNPATFIE